MGGPQSTSSRLQSRKLFDSIFWRRENLTPKKSTCRFLLMISSKSAKSTIGMAKVRLTCTTSWTSSRRSASSTAKLMTLHKFAKFDEVVKKVNEAVKEPEHSGNYHDYVELCKLYDKNENGTMMLAEL